MFSYRETIFLYITIVTIASFLGWLVSCSKNKFTELALKVLVFLVLFLPMALRYNVGTDYVAYVNYFYSPSLLIENSELGYYLINIVVQKLELDVQWVFVISSFVILVPVVFFIKKKDYFYILLIYNLLFYLESFNLVRQSISLSFVLLALYKFWYNKNVIQYLILVLISVLFHTSSVIFIPLVFLSFLHVDKKIYLFVIIFLGLFSFDINNAILLYEIIASFGSDYTSYAFTEYGGSVIDNMNSGIGAMIRTLSSLFPIFIKNNNENINDRLFTLCLLSATFFSVLGLSSGIFFRVYFGANIISCLVVIYLRNSNGFVKIIYLVILFLYYFYLFFIQTADEIETGVNPYRLIDIF